MIRREAMSFRLLHRLVILILLVAAPMPMGVSVGFSQSAKGPAKQLEKKLQDTYKELLRATQLKDEKSLRKILANDYTQVTADGRVRSKAERVKETLQSTDKITTLSLEDFQLRVYSDAAIALCRVKNEGVSEGKAYKFTILSTVIFIRQDRTWRIAATHLTFARE
jgi:hypothetical protein